MARTATKVIQARFSYAGLSSDRMLAIGTNLTESIRSRIMSGNNAEDQAAKPLTPRYAKAKTRRGIPAVRNWIWDPFGTIYQMQLKSVSQNRGVIGFTTQHADMVAHINNARERAFAVSPNDREVMRSSAAAEFQAAASQNAAAESVLSTTGTSFSGVGSFIAPAANTRRPKVTFS